MRQADVRAWRWEPDAGGTFKGGPTWLAYRGRLDALNLPRRRRSRRSPAYAHRRKPGVTRGQVVCRASRRPSLRRPVSHRGGPRPGPPTIVGHGRAPRPVCPLASPSRTSVRPAGISVPACGRALPWQRTNTAGRTREQNGCVGRVEDVTPCPFAIVRKNSRRSGTRPRRCHTTCHWRTSRGKLFRHQSRLRR